jgi:signal transduction histidine kinase
MAFETKVATLILLGLAGIAPLPAAGPERATLTLEQASARKTADFLPAHEGEMVEVKGLASIRPVHLLDAALLAIQDESLHGLLLQGSPADFHGVSPGDLLDAEGTIFNRFGLPALKVSKITILSPGPPPRPLPVSFGELNSFRYLGVLIVTEVPVLERAENGGGDLLAAGDAARPLEIFLPQPLANGSSRLGEFRRGDKVMVTGVSSQYCPAVPHNRLFEVLTPSASSVVLLKAGRNALPPLVVLGVVFAMGLAAAFVWTRGQKMAKLRDMMRTLHHLGEEIIAAGSATEIVKDIGSVLPGVLGTSGVRLYIFNAGSKTLDRVASPKDPEPISIPVDSPLGTIPTAATACFRNRTLLSVPDTRRSPFFKGGRDLSLPRAVLFIPLFAQNELLGILEIDSARVYNFSPDEQSAAQHLGNQIATALKLMEQQSIREQLFRSEKLAAAGQLISGVANELRAPLESVSTLAKRVLARHREPALEGELRAIWLEAQGASETVARLVAVTRPEQAQANLLDLNALLHSLMEFREREWRAQGLEVRNLMSVESIWVLGSLGQLEQVFLNLLVHAEQSVAEANERVASIRTSVMGKRAVVEIAYSSPDPEMPFQDPFRTGPGVEEGGGLGLEVCRGVIQSHGGEIRWTQTLGKGCRFEVELPIPQAPVPAAGVPARKSLSPFTVLLIEPERLTAERLLAQLSARGYRVVPVASAEEGADLVQRLRFDLVLCSVRLPGLNWVELFTKIRHQIGSFILLTESYDADLSRVFQPGEGYILAKPVQEPELDRLLGLAESHLEDTAGGAARTI